MAKIGLEGLAEGVVEGIAALMVPRLPSVFDAILLLSDNSQGSRGTRESSVRCASGFRFPVIVIIVTIN